MALMAIDITIPLRKYSSCSGQPGGSTLPWHHEYEPDLFLLLRGDGERSYSGPLTLQVVHATKVKEHVNIGELVDQAFNARRSSGSYRDSVPLRDLPISGIVKESALAIRHRRPGMHDVFDRIQLRLQSPTQCQEIKGVLSRRGMEFEERSSRPAPSNMTASRPGTAMLDDSSSIMRQSSPVQPEQRNPSTNPFRVPDMEAGSLSQYHSSRYSSDSRQSFHRPPTPPRFGAESESTASRHFPGVRSGNAPIPRSFTTQPPRTANADTMQAQAGVYVERPSSTSQTATLEAIRQAAEDEAPSHASSNTGSPSRQPWSSVTDSAHVSAPLSSDPIRPATAASATSMAAPQAPASFLRRDDSQLSSGRSSSRPGSSALGLPDLPRLPTVEKRPLSSMRAQTSSARAAPSLPPRPGTAMPQFRSPTVIGNGQNSTPTTLQPPIDTLLQSAQAMQPSENETSSSARQGGATATEKAIGMNELLSKYGRKPTQGSFNSHPPRITSMTDAPHEIESSPPTARSSRPDEATVGMQPPHQAPVPMDAAADRAYGVIHSPTRGPDDEELLERYHAQSSDERKAALEQFMIEKLEDPLFTTLCEDVESCWSRIALGL